MFFPLSEWHKGLAEALAWPIRLADMRNEISIFLIPYDQKLRGAARLANNTQFITL